MASVTFTFPHDVIVSEIENATYTFIPAKGDTPVKGVDYFTAEDIEEIISEVVRRLAPAKTVTGNPISITDALEATAQALSANIAPIQSGSGDPSPENVRAIIGRSGIVLMAGDGNLLPKPPAADIWESGYIRDTGVIANAGGPKEKYSTVYIPVESNADYAVSYALSEAQGLWAGVAEYDSNRNFIVRTTYAMNGAATHQFTFTTRSNTAYVRVALRTYDMVESFALYNAAAGEAHEAEPVVYKIDFPSEAGTVYSGTLDVINGALTVDRALVTIDGSSLKTTATSGRYYCDIGSSGTFQADADNTCSMFTVSESSSISTGQCYMQSGFRVQMQTAYETVSDFATAIDGGKLQFCFKLAEPVTYQLTGRAVALAEGSNTISTDAENLTLTYSAKVSA